jgi:hypothetical protein
LSERGKGRLALDPRDLSAQAGKRFPGHESAGAHGFSIPPMGMCSCFVLMIPENRARVKQSIPKIENGGKH